MSVGVVNKTTGDRIQTAGDPLDKVGNLANLTTTAKTDAVVAINEVNAGLATKADLTDLAPAFSTATAYAVGQYVSYNGDIYKCTSAHSAGAWVAGDFTIVAVGSELESKQNATDNNLTTTDKTIVGAICEVNSDVATYKDKNNVDISAPERHNILYASLSNIKSRHTAGTWSGDSYTHRGVTYAFTAINDIVTQVDVSGTPTDTSEIVLSPSSGFKVGQGFILSGCPAGGEEGGFSQYANYGGGTPFIYDKGDGATLDDGNIRVGIRISSTADLTTPITFYPMVRPSWDSDTTFSPYTPSIESRIEVVESGIPVLVAKSSATGTYSDKIAEIKSAYTALSNARKKQSYIIMGGARYNVGVLGWGHFNMTYYDDTSEKVYINDMDIATTSPSFVRMEIGENSVTVTDRLSTSNSNVFELWA